MVGPLFRRLFPGIPAGHPASGAMVMNFSANMLGLDNAATPLGLKAMKELQSLNPEPDTATDEMVLFMVINASSVTILPMTIFTFRAQMGAKDPTDVFVPILIATYCSVMTGLLVTSAVQKINLFNRVVLGWFGALTAVVGGMVWYFSRLDAATVAQQSAVLANSLLLGVIIFFLAAGARRKVPLYETFIEGAKDGFTVAVGIIPYLVAILVAVGALRASGALEAILGAIKHGVGLLAIDSRWVDALPTALIKPLSGGGARGMMVETMKTFGPDSFAGPHRLRDPGQHRDHVLRARGLLRLGGREEDPPRAGLRAVGGTDGRDRGDPGELFVLRLRKPPLSCCAASSAHSVVSSTASACAARRWHWRDWRFGSGYGAGYGAGFLRLKNSVSAYQVPGRRGDKAKVIVSRIPDFTTTVSTRASWLASRAWILRVPGRS